MFKIESYVTPILLSYVDKYVKDFKPADAQLSLWGGGVVLHNLVLKTDILQQEVPLPFTLVSGRIHELLIQVPWTKIMSEPIVVTIDIIECILNSRPPEESNIPNEQKSQNKTQVVEAPPGYMQALVRRIVSNITVNIHHLILKYVQDDLVLSLNVKHLAVESTGSNWKPAFADIEAENPVVRRIVTVDDLTLCLDSADSDGKIRFYQDPLLYRCQIELRVLMKLVSANTRRANSFHVHLFSTKLAFGVSNDQLFYLLRLLKEQPTAAKDTPHKDLKSTTSTRKVSEMPPKRHSEPESQAAEPSRRESWSEWAWSWMPTWIDREGSTEETTVAAQPLPVAFSAYCDQITLGYKVLDREANVKKKVTNIFDFTATHVALKASVCHPTHIKAKFGIRALLMKSNQRCACGHADYNMINETPTIYLTSKITETDEQSNWEWPEEHMGETLEATESTTTSYSSSQDFQKIHTISKTTIVSVSVEDTHKIAGAATAEARRRADLAAASLHKAPVLRPSVPTAEILTEKEETHNESTAANPDPQVTKQEHAPTTSTPMGGHDLSEHERLSEDNMELMRSNSEFFDLKLTALMKVPQPQEPFWESMNPAFLLSFVHERLPPQINTNPYENPPKDFEYSDWQEECDLKVVVKPLRTRLCMGLIHRVEAITEILKKVPETPIPPIKRLTIEESEALANNLPQRRISLEINGFSVVIHPWDHSLTEHPHESPVVLDIEFSKINLVAVMPLYPQRVCSATAQLPNLVGQLWEGSRLHVTTSLNNIQAYLATPDGKERKPFARMDARLVTHYILFSKYFTGKRTVRNSFMLQIKEANISGSSPRLYAVGQIILSLLHQQHSMPFLYTSLVGDALNDENLVAIDMNLEDLTARGFSTSVLNTKILKVQSLRATLFQSQEMAPTKQAWLFSGSDVPTSSPFLRMCMQLSNSPDEGLEYLGLWTEHTAIALDPLFVAWLSYKPDQVPRPFFDAASRTLHIRPSVSVQEMNKIRDNQFAANASSSGKGASRTASIYEKVHVKARSSAASSSDFSERKSSVEPPTVVAPRKDLSQPFLHGEGLLKLHKRLRKMMIAVDMGLILVYITTKTASAVDCATVSITMEKHATSLQQVMVFSVGRWSLVTNIATKHLWHYIRQDGPTYERVEGEAAKHDSFPWKMSLADMSCYSLEVPETAGIKSDKASGLRSHIKLTYNIQPRTVLELVTTSLVLSVVTKTLQQKVVVKKAEMTKHKLKPKKDKSSYFETSDFVPTTLEEFLRGPENRKSASRKSVVGEQKPQERSGTLLEPEYKSADGPMVSLGFNLHADTPPVVIRIEQDQIPIVSATIHCLSHLIALLNQNPMTIKRTGRTSFAKPSTSRTAVDIEEDANIPYDTSSVQESQADLQTIYTTTRKRNDRLSTFCLFQWVISRGTVVISVDNIKIALNIDDVITTVNIQDTYNQLKVKVSYVSLKYLVRDEDEQWVPGLMGGRVLEAREPTAKEDNQFISVTVTQARISNLPPSWKEELHPKLLENKLETDIMWEVYVVLAPLEMVVRTEVIDAFISFMEATTQTTCTVASSNDQRLTIVEFPYCYLNSGGVRILLSCEMPGVNIEDTIMFNIGKISLTPYPDNPICRRPANAGESIWQTAGTLEGRQYEFVIKSISIKSAKFWQLASQEQVSANAATGGENPARQWGERTMLAPDLTTILHPLDVTFIYAPAFYIKKTLACGSALEFNLVSDCSLEFSLNQVNLILSLVNNTRFSLHRTHEEFDNECPYAEILERQQALFETYPARESASLIMYRKGITDEKFLQHGTSITTDSGMDTDTTRSTAKSFENMFLKSSHVFWDRGSDPSEFLEIFVTMGIIEVSLYTENDGSLEVAALNRNAKKEPEPAFEPVPAESDSSKMTLKSNPSIINRKTETKRLVDSQSTFNVPAAHSIRTAEGNVPLLNMILSQPNLYYCSSSFQISLFNIWVGLGAGLVDGHWHSDLLSTASGECDPITEIPPALVTMKYTHSIARTVTSHVLSGGSLKMDVERPIRLHFCEENISTLFHLAALMKKRLVSIETDDTQVKEHVSPFYTLNQFMMQCPIEEVTIQTTQIAIVISNVNVGFDQSSLQMTWSRRPHKILFRSFISSFLISIEVKPDEIVPILHPLHLGYIMISTWEVWRRAESPTLAKEPSVYLSIDLDRVNVDLAPSTMRSLMKSIEAIKEISTVHKVESKLSSSEESNDSEIILRVEPSPSETLSENDHYYKDDLRSGAFKTVKGGQLPMAYQITIHKTVVSWRYPHPRAITRVLVYPLIDIDTEVHCILEFYNRIMNIWEAHTRINVPTLEIAEYNLHNQPPEIIFSTTWRFRVCNPGQMDHEKFVFNTTKFIPKTDPWELPEEPPSTSVNSGVSAERLLSVLRIDSYFAPRRTPMLKINARFTSINIHVHNAAPALFNQVSVLEGYYVSQPMLSSHRVLTISAVDFAVKGFFGSPSGRFWTVKAHIQTQLYDCTTGVMMPLSQRFQLQAALSVPDNSWSLARIRMCTSKIRVWMHIPRLRTIQSLILDWEIAYKNLSSSPKEIARLERKRTKREVANKAAALLEGRISLWIHNTTSSAIRIGQEGTYEVFVANSGARLTYRWMSPHCTKRLHFASTTTDPELIWSASTPFKVGNYRVRMESSDSRSTDGLSQAEYIYVNVKERGAHRLMRISGQLVLANMLRLDLHYKVKARHTKRGPWRTIATGELISETIGRSVICSTNSDFVLKVKFMGHDSGWSGDIPLKECPKENVPWLVKVPSQGTMPFVSVWCRVLKARTDGRIFAALWPLYVLHSYLTLDIDVMVLSELEGGGEEEAKQPPIVQAALGRGFTTHILAPGTTSARHSLTFQYSRNIESPLTQQAVPLHYGVTENSVFEKHPPVNNIEEVLSSIVVWLDRSGQHAKSLWPYSLVAKHYAGVWQPALLQPRCEIAVRYQPVRACAGCSLEIQLSPILVLCNAAPVNLTVRAHDAAPLCKLETGYVISLPSIVIEKPFFLSIEIGRETFVSGQLQVGNKEPGRYSALPPGVVTADRHTTFAIHCVNKVVLFNLYYEIINDINVMGITSLYVVINNIGQEFLISTVAVPKEDHTEKKNVKLQHKVYTVVTPSSPGSLVEVPLVRFRLHGRWRGGEVSDLESYVCIALPSTMLPAGRPVPIRLGHTPLRRPIALVDSDGHSLPVVVTQHRYEERWVVAVMHDPCPQFLVHNQTHNEIVIGQPAKDEQGNPVTSPVRVEDECKGVRWHEHIPVGAKRHYSTPDYTFVPQIATDTAPKPTHLIFAALHPTDRSVHETIKLDWCQPVVAIEGEQLVTLSNKYVIKMRLHCHPHTSLLELCDIDSNDVSASEIRRRLLDPTTDTTSVVLRGVSRVAVLDHLARVAANSKLLDFGPDDEINLSKRNTKKSHVTYDDDQTTADKESIETLSSESLSSMQSKTVVLPDPDEQVRKFSNDEMNSTITLARPNECMSEDLSSKYLGPDDHGPGMGDHLSTTHERFRCAMTSVVVELALSSEEKPIMALHVEHAVSLITTNRNKIKTTVAVSNIQIDNLQFDTGQYDFAVIATTCSDDLPEYRWPTLWGMFDEEDVLDTKSDEARLLLKTSHDLWSVFDRHYSELTEVEIQGGPIALYVEDSYVKALAHLFSMMKRPAGPGELAILTDAQSLRQPLRLALLHIHPLDMTLTLHTAVRMYIALDQSPLHLSSFRVTHVFTNTECLVHSLTVHYLSAALLGAGWVVGGLELLGAPGALAARVGGATGGVRGVAQAAAAGVVRSLSAWAGSLARNLDLLAGDEEHARRAAAARRHPPDSFVDGLMQGLTNFAVNMLGAVGGLAHHPLVGVAVGETESSASALRRSLLGALTKPLSATADLVAYAGHGLLKQTGWDPAPQARVLTEMEVEQEFGWRRDCVRWTFHLLEMPPFAGYEVLLDRAHMMLLLTTKFIIVMDPAAERIVESIDLRLCSLGPYEGGIIEIHVRTEPERSETTREGSLEHELSATAMARVARYTGAERAQEEVPAGETKRVLIVDTVLGQSCALHAALAALVHSNADTHFRLL